MSTTTEQQTLELVGQGAADAIARLDAAELPAATNPTTALARASTICEAVLGTYNGHVVWPLQHADHPDAHAAIVQGLERDHHARPIRAGGPHATALAARAMLDAMTTPEQPAT